MVDVATACVIAVSYTHLDVYKRQPKITARGVLDIFLLNVNKLMVRSKALSKSSEL